MWSFKPPISSSPALHVNYRTFSANNSYAQALQDAITSAGKTGKENSRARQKWVLLKAKPPPPQLPLRESPLAGRGDKMLCIWSHVQLSATSPFSGSGSLLSLLLKDLCLQPGAGEGGAGGGKVIMEMNETETWRGNKIKKEWKTSCALGEA